MEEVISQESSQRKQVCNGCWLHCLVVATEGGWPRRWLVLWEEEVSRDAVCYWEGEVWMGGLLQGKLWGAEVWKQGWVQPWKADVWKQAEVWKQEWVRPWKALAASEKVLKNVLFEALWRKLFWEEFLRVELWKVLLLTCHANLLYYFCDNILCK